MAKNPQAAIETITVQLGELTLDPLATLPSAAPVADLPAEGQVGPASVTTSPENGRNFIASFAASQSWWHVGATAAMSWASVSW